MSLRLPCLKACLLLLGTLLVACATPVPVPVPPVPVLLFGEQHDQPDQQRRVAATLAALAERGELAALVIEMAERGRHTEELRRDASAAEVRAALGWTGWDWGAYASVVMTAVRAGVPVHGGNLPRPSMRATMSDAGFDGRVPAPAHAALLEAVRAGHCGLLPEAQAPGMVRVQVARDLSMAATIEEAARRLRPGQRVVLLAGAQHVSKDRGVPLHLNPALARHVVMFGLAPIGDLQADQWQPSTETPRPDPCDELRRHGLRPRAPA